MVVYAPDGWEEEFANTFKEWHYLAGGFAAGVVAGVALMAYVVLVLADHLQGE